MDDRIVAAVAMQSVAGNKAENLERMDFFVRCAARQKAQWICFPELNISGYTLKDERRVIAESIPGPSTVAVLKMAREFGMVILAGLIEAGPHEELFISHVAISPEGILGIYRKVHLGPPEENLYRGGTDIPVFQYQNTRFGLELCYDAHFPELSTLLALKGAEVIFIPHASPRESTQEKQERWLRYLTARAYDNSVYVVACNSVGKEGAGPAFSGAGLVLSPRGEILTEAKGEGEDMILAELKGSLLKEVRESPHGFFMGRRRPELYKDLAV